MNLFKVVFSKLDGMWHLVDVDGFSVFAHKQPSVVRKAKVYWYCYLSLPNEIEAKKCLEIMSNLK